MDWMNNKGTAKVSQNISREGIKDIVLSLTETELDEVFAYMVKRGYIKNEHK